MKYMLAICAATIMLAVLETCENETERAAFTVTPAQPDTLVLFKNDDVDPIDTLRAPLFESNYPALESKSSVRLVLDPRDYNTVPEWRTQEEIVAGQKWLDSFFARLDSVLADTTKDKQ